MKILNVGCEMASEELLASPFSLPSSLSLFGLDNAFVPCLTCLSGVEVASFSLALRPVRLHPPTTRRGVERLETSEFKDLL